MPARIRPAGAARNALLVMSTPERLRFERRDMAYEPRTTELEREPYRALHNPRIPCCSGFPELLIDLYACDIESCRVVECAELRVIQQIVDLPAELQPLRSSHRDVLEERDVPVVDARKLEYGAWRIAEVAASEGPCEGIDVDP